MPDPARLHAPVPSSPRTPPSIGATTIRQLRTVGLIEGISFVLLLAVAMPLKYLAGLPQAVRYVGLLHGLLFMIYVGLGLWAGITLRWPPRRTLLVVAAAVLPLGPFLIDGRLKRLEQTV
jgi:integral membrane protein